MSAKKGTVAQELNPETCDSTKVNLCKICQASFTLRKNLKRHIETIHQNQKVMYECCNQLFTYKSTFMRHQKAKHNDVTKLSVNMSSTTSVFECDTCGAKYTRRDILLRHKRIMHSNAVDEDRSYVNLCKICQASFTLCKNLKRHIETIHQNQKVMYECCNQSFTYKSTFMRHRKTKHNVTRLSVNMSSTTSVFECDTCGAKYTRRDILLRHKRIVHSNAVDEDSSYVSNALATKRVRRPQGLKGPYKVVDPRMKKDIRGKFNKETKNKSKKSASKIRK